MQRSQSGLSLVGVGIVLGLIGLPTATVLVGTSFVNSAKLRKQISQVTTIQSAIQNFSNKYQCYPGDCRDPSVIAGYTYSGNGDGVLATDWDGDKNKGFWQHLSASGLVEGYPLFNNSAITVNMPKLVMSDIGFINAYGSLSYAQNVLELGTNAVRGALAVTDIAFQDRKMDDRTPGSGNVRSTGYGSASTSVYAAAPCFPLASSCNSGSDECITGSAYDASLTGANGECNMLFVMGLR